MGLYDVEARNPQRVEIDAEAVLKEINGYTVADGKPVEGFTSLKDDGSTACGCWIYSGCYQDGVNQTARRKPPGEQNWVAPEWAWAWPHNRRMLYNRASADPEGKPWSERKKYVWWDEEKRQWVGDDEPDFIVERPPSYRPGPEARGKDTIGGADPFVMQSDGKGWLFAAAGLQDGPLPTHYEPEESVAKNLLYGQQCNPTRMEWRQEGQPLPPPLSGPALPVSDHYVPHHRTSHCRRYEPLALLAVGIAAGDVLRSLAGTGRTGRPAERRLGYHPDRAR